MQTDLDRFLALVRRELQAENVWLVALGGLSDDPSAPARPMPPDPPAAGVDLRCALHDGWCLIVRFGVPPDDREAKQRRLEILATTFVLSSDMAQEQRTTRVRPPVGRSLQDELEGLRERAAASNVVVIDANSPVVWGAARPRGLIEEEPATSAGQAASEPVVIASRRALHEVRGLPELGGLHKGRHVRHVHNAGEAPLLARSFAGIYVLLLVFEAPFDELRAERATAESLSRIERLVLALPPLDPSPRRGAGVVAIRRPRRK